MREMFEHLRDVSLGLRVARDLRARRVGHEQEDALRGDRREPSEVGLTSVDRRVVELPVARVHDRAVRRFDGQADRVRDAVTDVIRVTAQATDGERCTRCDLAERGFLRELVLAQLGADEPERELGPVDRHVHEFPEHVRKGADVVLVGVRHQEAADPVLSGSQVPDVRDDEIDAEHLLVGEHETRVDDEDVVPHLDREHVLADLADAAEGDDPQRAVCLSQRA